MLGCIDYVLKFSMFRSREDKTIKNNRIIQHFKDNQIINAIASVYLEGSVIFYYGYNFTHIQQKKDECRRLATLDVGICHYNNVLYLLFCLGYMSH